MWPPMWPFFDIFYFKIGFYGSKNLTYVECYPQLQCDCQNNWGYCYILEYKTNPSSINHFFFLPLVDGAPGAKVDYSCLFFPADQFISGQSPVASDLFFASHRSLATAHSRQLGFRVKVRLGFSRHCLLPTAVGTKETAIINSTHNLLYWSANGTKTFSRVANGNDFITDRVTLNCMPHYVM